MPDVHVVLIVMTPTILAASFAFVPRRAGVESTRLVGIWLVLVAVAVTGAGDHLSAVWQSHQGLVNRVQSVLILVVCVAFAWLNRRGRPWVRGAVITVVVGAGLNAVATLWYGGMPVLRSAALTAGYKPRDLTGLHPSVGYVFSDDRGLFAHYAGDFVPVPGGHVVFSIGDILLWAGLAMLLAITFRSVAPIRESPKHSARIKPSRQLQ